VRDRSVTHATAADTVVADDQEDGLPLAATRTDGRTRSEEDQPRTAARRSGNPPVPAQTYGSSPTTPNGTRGEVWRRGVAPICDACISKRLPLETVEDVAPNVQSAVGLPCHSGAYSQAHTAQCSGALRAALDGACSRPPNVHADHCDKVHPAPLRTARRRAPGLPVMSLPQARESDIVRSSDWVSGPSQFVVPLPLGCDRAK
jgi:hypothetical protein